ncbi:CRISPR-associated helicase Cas3' [Chryseomicrobium imtechense]
MQFIAHIRKSDFENQTVSTHLSECKLLAESFGEKIGLKHLAGLASLLHDMGKYSQEFQNYLNLAVYEPENAPARGSVNHSNAGGMLLFERYHKGSNSVFQKLVAEIAGNAILSHHASLQDFINEKLESPFLKRVDQEPPHNFSETKLHFFKEVISEKDLDDYVQKASEELQSFIAKVDKKEVSRTLYFVTRFIFSTLIDADRTNTRRFEENVIEKDQEIKPLFTEYLSKLEHVLQNYKENASKTTVNELRQRMSDEAAAHADLPSGISTLSIPTGGGKTLASLRYALNHALKYNKRSIIYVVPFTTIIEQNAEEVSRIVDDWQNVIQHHSNVVDPDVNDEYQEGTHSNLEKIKLARDNWDAPVIFTTMVQFLETFYGHGSRASRRLHNLCESVIIFDEVQKVPTNSIALFTQAINFLADCGQSSIILCTATQPALTHIENNLKLDLKREIVPELPLVEKAFKRTQLIDTTGHGKFTTESLVGVVLEKQSAEQNVLVILNTKSVVKKLYSSLREKDPSLTIFHLSTTMCAAHRKEIIEDIRNSLKNNKPFVCVTTQLIEAGVDVDFNCVIRSLAGLDSIAQAAGRCNRHGLNTMKSVYLIDHSEEVVNKLDDIARGKEITSRLLKSFSKDPTLFRDDILSNEAMNRYFKEFYQVQQIKLNYPLTDLNTTMTELLFSHPESHPFVQRLTNQHHKSLSTFCSASFNTASKKYKVIQDFSKSVVVPHNKEGKELIADLSGSRPIESLSGFFKRAQHYSVDVFDWELRKLQEKGLLVSFLDGMILAVTENAYNQEFGIDLEGESSKLGEFMF